MLPGMTERVDYGQLTPHLCGLSPARETTAPQPTTERIRVRPQRFQQRPKLLLAPVLFDERIDPCYPVLEPAGRVIGKRHLFQPLRRQFTRCLGNAMDRVEQLLGEAGAIATRRTSLKEQAGFHIMGTAVMGLYPETSVTNQWGKSHEIDNLVIADASVFVTSSTMNPTATAQALALRMADHLVLGATIDEDAHH